MILAGHKKLSVLKLSVLGSGRKKLSILVIVNQNMSFLTKNTLSNFWMVIFHQDCSPKAARRTSKKAWKHTFEIDNAIFHQDLSPKVARSRTNKKTFKYEYGN